MLTEVPRSRCNIHSPHDMLYDLYFVWVLCLGTFSKEYTTVNNAIRVSEGTSFGASCAHVGHASTQRADGSLAADTRKLRASLLFNLWCSTFTVQRYLINRVHRHIIGRCTCSMFVIPCLIEQCGFQQVDAHGGLRFTL